MKRLLLRVACALSLALLAYAPIARSGVADLPGVDTAADMREWLKLTDDQVAKLEPVIAARITKVDAALDKFEAAEKPDPMAFVAEYGTIKKEFDAGVTNILTPDQGKQWGSFKAELEKDLVSAGAKGRLVTLQPIMKLTDEQVVKLEPAMTKAFQGKLDAVQKLADGSRVSMRDKMGAKRALDGINAELEKAMATIVSPDQLNTYKATMKAAKEARKG